MKLIIHNRINCYPFLDLAEALSIQKAISEDGKISAVATLNKEAVNICQESEMQKFYVVVTDNDHGNPCLIDSQGSATISFKEPFYTVI